MLQPLLATFLALSLAPNPIDVGRGDDSGYTSPEPPSGTSCPPKTALCTDGKCVPLAEPCMAGAERVAAPLETEVAPGPRNAPCLEPLAEFTKRRARRTFGLMIPGLVLDLIGLGILGFARESNATSAQTFGTSGTIPRCVNGQPCGNSCISWDKVCQVGSGSSSGGSGTHVTRAGLIAAVIFLAVGSGLALAGGLSYLRMERRVGSSCTAGGCGLTLRF